LVNRSGNLQNITTVNFFVNKFSCSELLFFWEAARLAKYRAADPFIFGSQAICRTDPIALRPCLATGLPFRNVIINDKGTY
jgi:hypothetical protein